MATLLGNETHAPAANVDALPASPPLVSLLTSADVTEEGTEREWGAGITYQPEGCSAPTNPYWWECYESGGADPEFTKDVPAREDAVRVRPFDVWDAVSCTAAQYRAEDWQARARRALLARQSFHVEAELWTGAIATLAAFPNNYLTNSPTALNGGAALGLTRAFAELEQALADNGHGRPGMIHAQPRVVTEWRRLNLVEPVPSGRQLRSALGTIVVPGAGYDGSGTGVAAGTVAQSWAYVTGRVRVWLGPIRLITNEYGGQTFDAEYDAPASVNDLRVRVERAAVYTFDPCVQHGVLVDQTTVH